MYNDLFFLMSQYFKQKLKIVLWYKKTEGHPKVYHFKDSGSLKFQKEIARDLVCHVINAFILEYKQKLPNFLALRKVPVTYVCFLSAR